MQGILRFRPLSEGGVRLQLSPTTTSPLAIDVAESTETRIQRLISENPVIIFTRSSCCMCHVMRRLLSTIGVHPTVIELEEDEIGALAAPDSSNGGTPGNPAPAMFIGGTRVGGLEDLVALHLSGQLIPKLVEVALSAEDRADLVNVLKTKLQDLAGDHPDFLDTLSPDVRKRVDVLREIQGQHEELEANFLEEKAALEAKYQKLYEPLYTKRYGIVNGLVEVEGVSVEGLQNQKTDQSTREKGVPNFWLSAMKNNEVLAEEISELDEGALQYLKDIKWSRIDGSMGFMLEFFYDPNPYFKNSVLTKTYHMINEDEHILEKAIGTEIEWFPGKILTQKIVKKKPKKGSKNLKPITKTEECFFNFFTPPQVPVGEDDIDDNDAELLQNQMEEDYDIGSTIGEKIIPHAVSWFTGEAIEFQDIEDDENGDAAVDADGEDDEDSGEEDDEKDEERGNNPNKKGGKVLDEVD